MLSVEREREKKKEFQIELSIETFQFSLNLFFFTQSRSSTESRHVPSPPPLPRSLVLVTSAVLFLSQSVFQFQTGHLLSRPSGIRSSCPFSVWTSGGTSSGHSLFPSSRTFTLPPGPPVAVHFSFFYFEVEFLRLCLSLSPQWLDANPSLTFSSFSTSYAPRL